MDRIRSQRLALLFIAALAVCLLAPAAEACPTCSQALADQSGGDIISGFFWSILFMMSMPFLILAFFGLYFYWQIRKARLANEAAKP